MRVDLEDAGRFLPALKHPRQLHAVNRLFLLLLCQATWRNRCGLPGEIS